MKTRIDIKSAVVGGLLVAGLCLLAGASGGLSAMIGRFQIACTDSVCYLVDTATGQVWDHGDPDFKSPKLPGAAAAKTPRAPMAGSEAFVGLWQSEDPDEDDLGLRLEADGRALATEGSNRHKGKWRVQGGRIFITIEDETVTGEIAPDGRLILWEEGDEDERIPFRRIQ